MIKIVPPDKHSRECNACGSEKNLQKILHGRHDNSTASLVLCASCRERLHYDIERVRPENYAKCCDCNEMTHLDDLSSCTVYFDRHLVEESQHDNLCELDNNRWLCPKCLNDKEYCKECAVTVEKYSIIK